MNEFFEVNVKLEQISNEIKSGLKEQFENIDKITEYNQQKVLSVFIKNRVSETHFNPTTGYGYGDSGRETLEKVFAEIVGAEDSLIRHHFVSGTHALTVALFGVLRPGDVVLSVMGEPYDTIKGVFGITPSPGSLAEFGIEYAQTELKQNFYIDYEGLENKLKSKKIKVIYIQRSRGYTLRPSLSVEQISEISRIAKSIQPETIVMVDNCYGEFVQCKEPAECGADLIIGSLIKNPGGAIAPAGGYIAGKKHLVELCAARLTTPSTGKEIGATLGLLRELYMGLYNAPHVTGEALKTAVYSAALFSRLGFDVSPAADETRFDIIQSIRLSTPERLIEFCRAIQSCSPVDSFVVPEPWDMPGYNSKVIMSAGAFTMGSSIELSADAPLKEPYVVWLQGGFNFHGSYIAVLKAADEMLKKGYIKL